MKEYPRGCDLASCHSEDLEGRRFVLAWSRYQELAASTAGWSEKNPFFFHVEITGNEIAVSTPFGSDVHVIEAMRSAS